MIQEAIKYEINYNADNNLQVLEQQTEKKLSTMSLTS